MRGRRAFLGSMATVAGIGLAGCSGDDGGTESETPTTSESDLSASSPADVDPTATAMAGSIAFPTLDADEPTYRKWIPADDSPLGLWGAVNLARIRESKSRLPADEYEGLTSPATTGDYLGIEFEAFDTVIRPLSGPGLVYPGEFDRSRIEETLTGMDYEQYDTRKDVAFYRQIDVKEAQRVAVGDEGVIKDYAGQREGFRERSMVLFETAAGDRTRYHEASDRFRAYTDAVGFPLWTNSLVGGVTSLGSGITLPESIRSSVVYGMTLHAIEGATVDRYWMRVAEDGDASSSEVRSTLEAEVLPDLRSRGNDVAIRSEERTIEVAALRPVAKTGGGTDPIQFTLRTDVEDGRLRVRHLGGDPVPLAHLTARSGDARTGFGDGALEPGESITIEIPEGAADRLHVVYSSPHTDATRSVAVVEVNTPTASDA